MLEDYIQKRIEIHYEISPKDLERFLESLGIRDIVVDYCIDNDAVLSGDRDLFDFFFGYFKDCVFIRLDAFNYDQKYFHDLENRIREDRATEDECELWYDSYNEIMWNSEHKFSHSKRSFDGLKKLYFMLKEHPPIYVKRNLKMKSS